MRDLLEVGRTLGSGWGGGSRFWARVFGESLMILNPKPPTLESSKGSLFRV